MFNMTNVESLLSRVEKLERLAEQYGWIPKEPLRVEFDGIVRTCAGIVQVRQCGPMGETFGDMLRQFDDKRVRVTVEELP